MKFEIKKGKIKSAIRLVAYGSEGIGKSTFASQFPDPLFIDVEGGTKQLDIARFPQPETWNDILAMVDAVIAEPTICQTLVIDTIDKAESMLSAQLLAEAVGQELGLTPVSTLCKVRHNRAQSGITGQAKRRANVLGAYKAVCPQQLHGKRVLILDDVITTGATAGECARVLLTAGAKEVHCGCIAAAHNHQ